ALAIRRAELDDGDLLVLEVQGDLGAVLADAGRFAEAEPLLRRYHAGTTDNPTHARRAAEALARLLTATGRNAEARRVLATAPPPIPGARRALPAAPARSPPRRRRGARAAEGRARRAIRPPCRRRRGRLFPAGSRRRPSRWPGR